MTNNTSNQSADAVNQGGKEAVAMEPDWKEIAIQIARRLNFALAHGKFSRSGFMLNMKTNESQGALDYLADGLEMIPGVTVDRERLYMTPAERKKHDKLKVKS